MHAAPRTLQQRQRVCCMQPCCTLSSTLNSLKIILVCFAVLGAPQGRIGPLPTVGRIPYHHPLSCGLHACFDCFALINNAAHGHRHASSPLAEAAQGQLSSSSSARETSLLLLLLLRLRLLRLRLVALPLLLHVH